MEKQLIKQNESLQVQLDALLQENLSLREKLAEAPPPQNQIKNQLKIPDLLEKQLQAMTQENSALNGKLQKYLEIINEQKLELAQNEKMLIIFQRKFSFEFCQPQLDQRLKTACLNNQAKVYEDKSLSITTFTSFMDGIITVKYTLISTKPMQIDFQCRRTVNLQIDLPHIQSSALTAHQPSEFILNIKINRLPYELPAIFFIFEDQQVSQLVPCSINKTFLASTCNEFNDLTKIECKVSSLKGIPERFQFENQNFKLTVLDNKQLQISGPPEISQRLITQLLPLLVD